MTAYGARSPAARWGSYEIDLDMRDMTANGTYALDLSRLITAVPSLTGEAAPSNLRHLLLRSGRVANISDSLTSLTSLQSLSVRARGGHPST